MQIEVVTPFPEHAVPRIWTWEQDFRRRVADDFAPQTLEAFMADWAARGRAGQQRWAVCRDGEIGGLVTFDRWSPVVGCTHWIFCKRFWGAETTLTGIREATRQIFETTGVSKLVGFCFADNWQVIGTAKKLGWRREGWLRQHTLRDGKPTDMVLLGLLREEFDDGVQLHPDVGTKPDVGTGPTGVEPADSDGRPNKQPAGGRGANGCDQRTPDL